MPKIEILRNTAANAKPVFVGDVIEVTEATAVQLIRSGKAKAYEAKVIPQEEAKPKQAKAKASKKKSSAKAKSKSKSNTQKKDK